MESTSAEYKIYIKDKNGVYFLNPFVDKNHKLFSVDKASNINSSIKYTAITSEGKVKVYDNQNLNLVKFFEEYESVVAVDFSQNNKYIVIIQKPAVPNNLKIISLENFQIVKYFLNLCFLENFIPFYYSSHITMAPN